MSLRILLVLALAFWVLMIVTYRSAGRTEADDFGAAVPVVFCAAAAIALTLAYVGAALFEHRLW